VSVSFQSIIFTQIFVAQVASVVDAHLNVLLLVLQQRIGTGGRHLWMR